MVKLDLVLKASITRSLGVLIVANFFDTDGNRPYQQNNDEVKRGRKDKMSKKTKYYIEGHITVFLSLILTLILSVVCTTIESARLQGVRMQIQNITDMGIYSAFAEYNRDLLDRYDLFFLDMGYGTEDGSIERLNARIKSFTEYNTETTKGLEAMELFRYSEIWRAKVTSVMTDQHVLATDYNAKAYYSQAITYMENKLGLSIVQGLVGQYNQEIIQDQENFEEYKEDENNLQSEINSAKEAYQAEYEAALEAAKEENSEVEIPPKPPEVYNPADTIKGLQASPILELVMEDSSSLSSKRIRNFNGIASKRDLKTGNGTFQGKGNGAINKAIFNEYIFEKFPNFLTDDYDNEDALLYQAEYILGGKDNDKANFEAVVNKLLLMREGINFTYLLTDSIKREAAAALAATIVGYLGPLAVIALQTILLLSWAFAESVLEIRMLLIGKKVALIKNSSNWNLSLENLGNLTEVLDTAKEEEGGIDYEGYLKLLMYFSNQNNKIKRSIDLIELNLQEINKKFRIDNCIQGFKSNIQYEAKGLFLRLPFKMLERGNDAYTYSVTTEFSYY